MSKLLKILGVFVLVAGIIGTIIVFKNTNYFSFWQPIIPIISSISVFALLYGIGKILENVEEILTITKINSYNQNK